VLSPRQELILGKVVEGYLEAGQPVGSKAIASDADIDFGPSTIRNELAQLEEHGLLAHPHTSAGRVPTDAGYRYFVDKLLPARKVSLELSLIRREVDEAMRATSEALSQVTNLLAIVTAPPIETATIRHIEVLLLQPQVLMVVVITSTGGVTKRVFTFDEPVDSGLVTWAGEYLNEQLDGVALGGGPPPRSRTGSPSRRSTPASSRSSPRCRRRSPSWRRPPSRRSTWTAPRGCCPSTASRTSARSTR
jgi:heat-inducible transcriptional repressor